MESCVCELSQAFLLDLSPLNPCESGGGRLLVVLEMSVCLERDREGQIPICLETETEMGQMSVCLSV